MTGPQIIDCEQGTPEWHAARSGIPTASMFATVMASGRDGGNSATRRTYMLKLAGEILTGAPSEGYSNAHMERGNELEPDARNLYSFMQDVDVQQVGFIRNGNAGYSPDGLIGSNGAVEIKTKLPHLQLDVLLRDKVPAEHIKQIQGGLWIAEREWVDFVSYWPGLPIFVKRVYRDEALISEIASAVAKFNEELAGIVETIRAMGGIEQ